MTRTSGNSRRKQLLIDFLRVVWSDGDVEACERFLSAAYTIHHDPGDPWAGQTLDVAGFRNRLCVSRAPFPDQCFDVVGLFEDADVVVVTWHWHATHLGDLPGLPATGRCITTSGTTAYTFADDRLTGHWQVVDRLGVLQQLQR